MNRDNMEAPHRPAAGVAASAERRLWFVIPAFNEAARIGEVVTEARPHGNVVVIDDGSRDATGPAALAAGAALVTHPINRGQGAALQTGIAYALKAGATHIVTFDADGQHCVADALKMVDRLDEAGLDLVIGSRFLGEARGLPALRRVVLKAAVAFTNFTTGLKLTDAHNGLRALSRAAAEQIDLKQDRMAHASEFLSIVAEKKLRFEEAPVTILYTAYSLAKGQRLRNSISILEDLLFGRLAK